MARLGSRLTYSEAREELQLLWGLSVSTAAIRDATLRSGQVAQELVEAEVQRLEREAPTAQARPEQLVMSVDGAFVQLTSGDCTRVSSTRRSLSSAGGCDSRRIAGGGGRPGKSVIACRGWCFVNPVCCATGR